MHRSTLLLVYTCDTVLLWSGVPVVYHLKLSPRSRGHRQRKLLLDIDLINLRTVPLSQPQSRILAFESSFVMSEASLEVEAPVATINPSSSRAPEKSEHSAVDMSDDASAAQAIADIAIFLGRGSNPPLTIRDVLAEIKNLRLALNEALPQVSKQDAQEGERSTARPHEEDSGELRSNYREELERLKKTHEETELQSKRSEILSILDNICVGFPLPWHYYQYPIFRFKMRPESPNKPYHRVLTSTERDPQLIEQVSSWLKAQRHWERMPEVPTHWCPVG